MQQKLEHGMEAGFILGLAYGLRRRGPSHRLGSWGLVFCSYMGNTRG